MESNIGLGCVAGLFDGESQAERAIRDLKDAGFTNADVGVASSNRSGNVASGGFWNKVGELFGKHEHPETAEEFGGSLEACGLSEQQAEYFNSSLDDGRILVTVRAGGERASHARAILKEAGGDIGSETTGRRSPAVRGATGERRIQLLGEVLRVHKERVQRGEVRLRKEVVSDSQNIEVPVTREELVIERVPGKGREASGQVGSGEKEIRVPLSEERVNVEKKPVVNEEVVVGKRQVQDTKRVADTVRREELRGEHEGDVTDESVRDLEKKKRTA